MQIVDDERQIFANFKVFSRTVIGPTTVLKA